ncbi:hypothetical protein [Nonomuraea sp. NPDC050310]|uniref:hypothetical protein n=1 Tax=Nonomuraea sp. NPDC050310 TaxID=3154935 RepID=UPI00340FE69A
MGKESAAKPVADSVSDIERAFDAATAAIRAESDAGRAYEGATELVETLRRLFEKSADLRAESAARIFDTEQMSLAVLADRIGVSKARAAQLIKTAKSATESQRDATTEDPK